MKTVFINTEFRTTLFKIMLGKLEECVYNIEAFIVHKSQACNRVVTIRVIGPVESSVLLENSPAKVRHSHRGSPCDGVSRSISG